MVLILKAYIYLPIRSLSLFGALSLKLQLTPPPHKSAFARMCSDFTHLGGKIFKGTETVLDAEAWLSSCERIFSHMKISGHYQVLVASSMLQERALH